MSPGGDRDEPFAVPTEVEDQATLDAIYALRVSVWRQNGGLAAWAFRDGVWRDEVDEVSRHWVVTAGRQIVGSARLSVHPGLDRVPEAHEYLNAGLRLEGPVGAPARVVVAPDARRRGLAALLLQAQDDSARYAGAVNAVRQASPVMRRLLLRRGWREVGPASIDARFPGVEFRIMARDYRSR